MRGKNRWSTQTGDPSFNFWIFLYFRICTIKHAWNMCGIHSAYRFSCIAKLVCLLNSNVHNSLELFPYIFVLYLSRHKICSEGSSAWDAASHCWAAEATSRGSTQPCHSSQRGEDSSQQLWVSIHWQISLHSSSTAQTIFCYYCTMYCRKLLVLLQLVLCTILSHVDSV